MTEVCHIFFTFVVHQTGPLGYPPANHAVRKFLANIDNDVDMDLLSYIRVQHFLNALFRVTLDTVASFGASSRVEQVQRFYEFMSDGQTMNSSGLKRSQFYEDVVSMAKSVCHTILKFFTFV